MHGYRRPVAMHIDPELKRVSAGQRVHLIEVIEVITQQHHSQCPQRVQVPTGEGPLTAPLATAPMSTAASIPY